jgi:hypothetical protein
MSSSLRQVTVVPAFNVSRSGAKVKLSIICSHGLGSLEMISQGGFIAYYRVSTGKQGKSGLGIEAQRQADGCGRDDLGSHESGSCGCQAARCEAWRGPWRLD